MLSGTSSTDAQNQKAAASAVVKTGNFERYLSLVLVLAFGLTESVGTVLVPWIGAKLLANWQRQSGGGTSLPDQIIRAHTFIALMAGTLSVGLGFFVDGSPDWCCVSCAPHSLDAFISWLAES
jgi:hypothetical protein